MKNANLGFFHGSKSIVFVKSTCINIMRPCFFLPDSFQRLLSYLQEQCRKSDQRNKYITCFTMNTERENYYYFFSSGRCPQRFVLALIQLSVRRLKYLQIRVGQAGQWYTSIPEKNSPKYPKTPKIHPNIPKIIPRYTLYLKFKESDIPNTRI